MPYYIAGRGRLGARRQLGGRADGRLRAAFGVALILIILVIIVIQIIVIVVVVVVVVAVVVVVVVVPNRSI